MDLSLLATEKSLIIFSENDGLIYGVFDICTKYHQEIIEEKARELQFSLL